MHSYKEQDDFYSKMKHLYTFGSICPTQQSTYNSRTSPFLYIWERPQSNSPSLLSPSFDRVMSSAKITSSTPVPQEMECQWCRRFNQWEVKEQITDNMPLPRVLATLCSGPHLMGHNIILRHVLALYTSSNITLSPRNNKNRYISLLPLTKHITRSEHPYKRKLISTGTRSFPWLI